MAMTKQVSCHLCKKEFPSKTNVELHINAVHLRIRPYECTECGQMFNQKGHCFDHLWRIHRVQSVKPQHWKFHQVKSLMPFICKTSRKGGKSSIPQTKTCPVCKKVFTKKEYVVRHIKSQHLFFEDKEKCDPKKRNQKAICPVCKKNFTQRKNMVSHLKLQHPSSAHPKKLKQNINSCIVCRKVFANRSKVLQHMKSEHPAFLELSDQNGSAKKVTCTLCKKSFTRHASMLLHMEAQHPTSIYSRRQKENSDTIACLVCRKSFTTKYKLHLHMRSYHSTLNKSKNLKNMAFNVACPICKKTYTTKTNMLRHMRLIHRSLPKRNDPNHSTKKTTCPFCKKIFTRHASMVLHVKSQHPSSIYSKPRKENSNVANCPVCKKSLTTKYKLHLHMRLYHPHLLKSKNLKNMATKATCPICKKSFTGKTYMLKHMRLTHPSALKKPSGRKCSSVKKLACSICKKSFSSHETMSIHMRLQHRSSVCSKERTGNTNIAPACSFCKKTFPPRTDMLLHMTSCYLAFQRNNKPDKFGEKATCPDCKKNFSTRSNMIQHMKRHHPFSIIPFRTNKSGKSNICFICHKSFTRKKNLLNHVTLKHHSFKVEPGVSNNTETAMFSCEKSEVTLHSDTSTSENVQAVHSTPNKSHISPDCEPENVRPLSVHTSLSVKSNERTKCPDCCKIFSNKHNMLRHRKSAHTSLRSPSFTHSSSDSDTLSHREQTFTSNNAISPDCEPENVTPLSVHTSLSAKSNERTKCPDCCKIFSNKHNMLRHRKSAHILHRSPSVSHPSSDSDTLPQREQTFPVNNENKIYSVTYEKRPKENNASLKLEEVKSPKDQLSNSLLTTNENSMESNEGVKDDIHGKSFSCQEGQSEGTERLKKEHFNTTNVPNKEIECDKGPLNICTKYTDTYTKSSENVQAAHSTPNKSRIFPDCEPENGTPLSYLTSVFAKSNERTKCPDCCKIFSNKHNMLRHRKSAHISHRSPSVTHPSSYSDTLTPREQTFTSKDEDKIHPMMNKETPKENHGSLNLEEVQSPKDQLSNSLLTTKENFMKSNEVVKDDIHVKSFRGHKEQSEAIDLKNEQVQKIKKQSFHNLPPVKDSFIKNYTENTVKDNFLNKDVTVYVPCVRLKKEHFNTTKVPNKEIECDKESLDICTTHTDTDTSTSENVQAAHSTLNKSHISPDCEPENVTPLSVHTSLSAKSNERTKCPDCCKIFSNKQNMLRHRKSAHISYRSPSVTHPPSDSHTLLPREQTFTSNDEDKIHPVANKETPKENHATLNLEEVKSPKYQLSNSLLATNENFIESNEVIKDNIHGKGFRGHEERPEAIEGDTRTEQLKNTKKQSSQNLSPVNDSFIKNHDNAVKDNILNKDVTVSEKHPKVPCLRLKKEHFNTTKVSNKETECDKEPLDICTKYKNSINTDQEHEYYHTDIPKATVTNKNQLKEHLTIHADRYEVGLKENLVVHTDNSSTSPCECACDDSQRTTSINNNSEKFTIYGGNKYSLTTSENLCDDNNWSYDCPACKMAIIGSYNLVMHIKAHMEV